MTAISMEVLQQLEEAQSALAQSTEEVAGPAIEALQIEDTLITGAGNGTANHVLVDHFFTSTLRRLWAFVGGSWRYHNISSLEEEGLAQVAFVANRVDVSWDDSNVLTFVRCWKTF